MVSGSRFWNVNTSPWEPTSKLLIFFSVFWVPAVPTPTSMRLLNLSSDAHWFLEQALSQERWLGNTNSHNLPEAKFCRASVVNHGDKLG
jgi:hypothetical protein